MIRIQGLKKAYPGTDALNGITFDVPRGEIFGFVGPNGAGKTTTLRILATLLKPTSGIAEVDGHDVTSDAFQVREEIGYMPDFFGVYDQLTTTEYLSFYAGCYRIPRSRRGKIAADLLELVRLTDKANAEVNSLSRGMKQRLCLARALVHDPALLLLDEPASGLDPRARIEMRELLLELRQMGKTIVISSHILPELAEMCSLFGIIDHGRMLAYGTLNELTGLTGDGQRARVVVAGDTRAAARVAKKVEGVTSATIEPDGLLVNYRDGIEPDAVLAALVTAGVRVRSFNPVEPDLEDTFMRVTEGRSS